MSDEDKQRAAELRETIELAHASDRERIARGEIKPSDLFWISEDAAKRAAVAWRCSYTRKRSGFV